jgi:hypothetical protein
VPRFCISMVQTTMLAAALFFATVAVVAMVHAK